MTQVNLKKNESSNYLWVWAGICVPLAIMLLILGGRIQLLKLQSAGNIKKVNQELPGFSEKKLEQIRDRISFYKEGLKKLSTAFDTNQRWKVQDYDLSIYFVEELNNVNQELKAKADRKNVKYPGLGFKEQLPSEDSAIYLLSQLDALKEIVTKGIDYGVNFSSIIPQDVETQTEEQDKTKKTTKPANGQEKEIAAEPELEGIKVVKSNLEMVIPAETLTEFIIQLNEIMPKIFFEKFYLVSAGFSYKLTLTVSGVIINSGWIRDSIYSFDDVKLTLPKADRDFAQLLRANSPFAAPVVREAGPVEETDDSLGGEDAGEKARFYYRGKAVLQSEEVAVIEDTLNEETFFLNKQDRIGGFVLEDFSETEALLRDSETFAELKIKKQEGLSD